MMLLLATTTATILLLLSRCSASLVTLDPFTLTSLSINVPAINPDNSLVVYIQGGDDGELQVTSSFLGSFSSWSVNLKEKHNHTRPLCVSSSVSANSTLFLSLLSTSVSPQTLKITVQENYEYRLKEKTLVSVPWNQNSVFRFDPGEDDGWNREKFLITIDNPGGSCLEVGISSPHCPWYNDIHTIRLNPIWTQVLTRSLIPIEAIDFLSSLVIMIQPAQHHKDCFRGPSDYILTNETMMKVMVKKVSNDYVTPMMIVVVVLLVVTLPPVTGLILFWRRKWNKSTRLVDEEPEEQDGCLSRAHDLGNMCLSPKHNQDIDVGQVDAIVDEMGDRHIRQRSTQMLPELVIRFLHDGVHRYLRSDAYFHVVPLLMVFYIIPSVQLVFMNVNANSDTCFFNYGCAKPWWIFNAYNHIFSNLGYIWFGLCFILLAWAKSFYFEEDVKHKKHRGLPQQYGLYYAMGLATVGQGFLSAIFHVCPSNLSLQFDTTMMYLIMTLVMVKIYQFRHPDTTINAFHCLAVLALALVFEAISVHLIALTRTHVAVFTALFCLLYVCFIILLGKAFYIHRQGRSLKSRNAIQCFSCLVLSWIHVCTIFWFIMVNLAVLIYVILSVWGKEKSLSTPLLLVIGGNMFLYLFYYMARKFGEILLRISDAEDRAKEIEDIKEVRGEENHGAEDDERESWAHWITRIVHLKRCENSVDAKQEEIEVAAVHAVSKQEADHESQLGVNLVRWLSFILFSTAFFIAIVAGFFYANKHQSRNLSPAQSREKNAECGFFEFFDNHDMWHLFSSLAVFLAFLGLLTIDDDLLYVSRDRIKVF